MKTDLKRMMTANHDLLDELLPPTAKDICGLIGLELFVKLTENFGGLDFYVPTDPKADNAKRLMEVIGRTASLQLMQVYGGAFLYINACTELRRVLRNQAFFEALITKMEKEDISQTRAIQELAPVFGFTERHAYSILKSESVAKPLSLFETI